MTTERTSLNPHVVFRVGFAGAFHTPQQEARWTGVRAVSAVISMAVGYADCGTRFLARFKNIPAGVRLFVSCTTCPARIGGFGQEPRVWFPRTIAAGPAATVGLRTARPSPSQACR